MAFIEIVDGGTRLHTFSKLSQIDNAYIQYPDTTGNQVCCIRLNRTNLKSIGKSNKTNSEGMYAEAYQVHLKNKANNAFGFIGIGLINIKSKPISTSQTMIGNAQGNRKITIKKCLSKEGIHLTTDYPLHPNFNYFYLGYEIDLSEAEQLGEIVCNEP